MKQKVIFILGPTGAGKTNLSIRLAKSLNGQIISADSVQIYKKFDIGSAKVTKEEMQGVVHYGIDIKEPNEEFSVFEYVNFTKDKIDEIVRSGHMPIIVGGTGLYVKALTENFNFAGSPKDEVTRRKIEEEISIQGNEKVFAKLKSIRPDLADKLSPNNTPRLIRAMEIALLGGKQTTSECDYDFKIFAINMDRELLYKRINKRAELMFENGLVDEVEKLYAEFGFTQAMKAIGYKEVVDYITGKITKDKAIELVKQHSRNYAKRQLTFLRGMKDVQFINGENQDEAFRIMLGEVGKWIKA